MKSILFLSLLKISLGYSILFSQNASAVEPRYSCQKDFDGYPITVLKKKQGYIPMFRWVDNTYPRPWTPQYRCETVSQRLQKFHTEGKLDFLKADRIDSIPVLCVPAYLGGPCRKDGILVTFKSSQHAFLSSYRLFDPKILSILGPINISDSLVNDTFIIERGESVYFYIRLIIESIEANDLISNKP